MFWGKGDMRTGLRTSSHILCMGPSKQAILCPDVSVVLSLRKTCTNAVREGSS